MLSSEHCAMIETGIKAAVKEESALTSDLCDLCVHVGVCLSGQGHRFKHNHFDIEMYFLFKSYSMDLRYKLVFTNVRYSCRNKPPILRECVTVSFPHSHKGIVSSDKWKESRE